MMMMMIIIIIIIIIINLYNCIYTYFINLNVIKIRKPGKNLYRLTVS